MSTPSFWELAKMIEVARVEYYRMVGDYPVFVFVSPEFSNRIKTTAHEEFSMKADSKTGIAFAFFVGGQPCMIYYKLPGISVCTYDH